MLLGLRGPVGLDGGARLDTIKASVKAILKTTHMDD
jgi:hypothetical protein